jgi:hypothetical protein
MEKIEINRFIIPQRKEVLEKGENFPYSSWVRGNVCPKISDFLHPSFLIMPEMA